MRYLALATMAIFLFSNEQVLAYSSQMYGHGIMPGAQSCGYGAKPANAMYDKDADYREFQRELKEAKKELAEYKKIRTRKKRDLKDHKKDAEDYLEPYAQEQVITHIMEGKTAQDYYGNTALNRSPACSTENPGDLSDQFCVELGQCAPSSLQIADGSKDNAGCIKNDKGEYTGKYDEWTNLFIKGKPDGQVSKEICSRRPMLDGVKAARCIKWLERFNNDGRDFREAEERIKDLEYVIKDLNRDLRDRKKDIRDEIDDGTFVATEDEDSEAGFCPTCWMNKHSETIKLVAGIGLPILGAYAGYKGAQRISEQNARLGWPTSPYIASGIAYPFIMQGIYGGIMGGMGAGGFGCAGGYYGGAMGPYGMGGIGGLFGSGMYGGMGGAFGYPGSMYGSPWGMGPYMPGMGPWGMGGPMMGGYPGGGMMIGGMMGGYPGGGMMGGYPGGGMMMGGYPGAGMMGGGMMMGGYPMGGYPGGGGMMGGYPGAGMMGGYPGAGMMGGGMMMGGMMGGYPVGGMMGGYPMGGMTGGYPGAGMMGGGMMGGMQMQQQYMQQYMQQMQQQMQYQMQAQQEAMQKQQIIGRLTQELYKIQMQIQQISTGSLHGGSVPYSPYSVMPNYGGSGSGAVGGGSSGGSVFIGR